MYLLVSRVPTGLAELRNYLNEHIHSQGSLAIDKCGDQCANVRLPSNPLHYITLHYIVIESHSSQLFPGPQ